MKLKRHHRNSKASGYFRTAESSRRKRLITTETVSAAAFTGWNSASFPPGSVPKHRRAFNRRFCSDNRDHLLPTYRGRSRCDLSRRPLPPRVRCSGSEKARPRLGRAANSRRTEPQRHADRELVLSATASPAASTPAAPLTAQSHGVGRESIALTISIPVGNPKPMSIPEGGIAVSDTAARMARSADANFAMSTGNQNGRRMR